VKVAVVFSALPADGGGAFTFEASVRRGLDELAETSGHEFVLYAPGEGGTKGVIGIPQTKRERFGRVLRRRVLAAQDRVGGPRAKLRTWFQRSLEDQGVEFVWFASFYFEECDQPYMATVWDLAHIEYPWFPEVGGDGQWERRQAYFERYLGRAARVVVPNAALTDLLVRAFPMPRERVVEIPFATPEWALDPGDRDDDAVLRRLGIDRPYLFYPAQFWAHKNHTTALAVLEQLAKTGTDGPDLVLAGSDKGTADHVRASAAALGVGDRVHFLGFVEQADLVSLYRRARALLYLSFFGPANLPPLEACALGCPVICADVPGMRLQLGDSALFVPPTDVGAIVAAVKTLADPKTREPLVASGRELAQALTSAGYVGRVLDVLDGFAVVRRTWRH
jgi:glycosyltransferase involved in cell wall biosynthesis